MRLTAAFCLPVITSCSVAPGVATRTEPANVCASGASLFNPEAAPGIGGTGQLARDPGIGGTGQIALRPGIGGTGRAETRADAGRSEIGLVGIVTGFASICVNGVEVRYTPSTPVIQDGEPSHTRDLAVGQIVAVRAAGTLDNANTPPQAQQIAVLHAAVGPLTRVDKLSGAFEVMGQPAQALATNDLSQLRPGDWVRVSGHRLTDGTIRASLVRAITAPLPPAQVMGVVTAIRNNTVDVGATVVQFDALPEGVAVGREIAVQGLWSSGRLIASKSALQPTRAELGTVNTVVLQGHVHALRGNELWLGYDSVALANQVRLTGGDLGSLTVDKAVRVRGHLDSNQRFVADQITIGGDGDGRAASGMSPQGHSAATSSPAHNGSEASASAGASGSGSGAGGGGGSGGGGGGSGGGGGGR